MHSAIVPLSYFLPLAFPSAGPQEEPAGVGEPHGAAGVPGERHYVPRSRELRAAALQRHRPARARALQQRHLPVHHDAPRLQLCTGEPPCSPLASWDPKCAHTHTHTLTHSVYIYIIYIYKHEDISSVVNLLALLKHYANSQTLPIPLPTFLF